MGHLGRRAATADLSHSGQCHYPDLTTLSASSKDLEQRLPPSSDPATDPVQSPRPGPTASNRQLGYRGYTSHNSIFEETESHLELLVGSAPPEANQLDHGVRQDVRRVSFRDLPVPLRETCLLVLRCLPGQSNEQIWFRDRQQEPKGWADVAVDRIMYSLQSTYGHLLKRGDAGLEAMAEILCINTTRAVRDDFPNSQQWLEQFYGKNLRWESLGLCWAHLVRVSDVLDALRPRDIEWIEGKESLETARTCLEYCITMARHFTNGNVLLLDLSRRLSTLSSIIDGDESFSSHASHGVTIAMMAYLGLHALEDKKPYKPTFSSEYKRRLATQIFVSDKLGIAFTGRPPFITGRYCSIPLPLDICDEDLASEEAAFERACSFVDEAGWNTRGGLYPATVTRARAMTSFVRDELLEIALGKGVFATTDQLLNIKTRQQAIVSGFPESLKYRPEHLNDSSIDNGKLYIAIIIQLDHLQNIFFAERLLLQHGNADTGDLLATSFELVCLTLKLWTHKDRFADTFILRNFQWLVMAYGAPGGGILCQELLYPSFTGTHSKHSEMTRSTIVQQLSLLVGFLAWVRPTKPNGDLCADTRAIIQRILDHHLNSGTDRSSIFDAVDWGSLAQPDFNFDLLDTFEWMRNDI
ncbi:hypothetical protein QQS21_002557 [Conoideocrella luteorostrata]|uniref:Xylanolytic transcriptional activator regulatory domain-containing protein n=1 Tax=Conoideocrella luteorostrata TaxID=1105319 RepID=A0AAJ0CXE2_9HYPO|nr:hypothetical protein QQS21_002557 [Conoideocrella luteorostrata]